MGHPVDGQRTTMHAQNGMFRQKSIISTTHSPFFCSPSHRTFWPLLKPVISTWHRVQNNRALAQPSVNWGDLGRFDSSGGFDRKYVRSYQFRVARQGGKFNGNTLLLYSGKINELRLHVSKVRRFK